MILVFPDGSHLVLDFFTEESGRPPAVLNLFPSAAGRRTVAETVVVPIDAVNLSSDNFCFHLIRVFYWLYTVYGKKRAKVCVKGERFKKTGAHLPTNPSKPIKTRSRMLRHLFLFIAKSLDVLRFEALPAGCY